MAKADTSRIEALDAILAEKRKHESYLEKLEARREATPANVFARLRDEYLTKLTDLQVRASMEADALAESLQEDEAAVAEIESRLSAIVEERIEGELRAEVGEYDPKDWGEKLKALNASVAKIEKERDVKVASFERTRALLVEARGAVLATEAPVVSAPIDPPRVSVPTPAPVARMTPPPIPTQPAAPVSRVSAAEAMPAVPVPPPVVRPPTPVAPVAAVTEAPVAAPSAPPEPPAPEPVSPQAKPTAPMAGSPSFDELAFLNSVVGRVSVPMKPEPPAPRPSKPISEIRDATAMKTPVPAPPVVPPAPAPMSASTPELSAEPESGPLGRPTPRTSQAIKTLKCQECGTLNYPTEWYCERCGGELAAL